MLKNVHYTRYIAIYVYDAKVCYFQMPNSSKMEYCIVQWLNVNSKTENRALHSLIKKLLHTEIYQINQHISDISIYQI